MPLFQASRTARASTAEAGARYGSGGLLGARAPPFGVRRDEPQADQVGAQLLDALASPGCRGIDDVGERRPKVLRPVLRHRVEHLERDERAVWARSVAYESDSKN